MAKQAKSKAKTKAEEISDANTSGFFNRRTALIVLIGKLKSNNDFFVDSFKSILSTTISDDEHTKSNWLFFICFKPQHLRGQYLLMM